MEWHYVLINMSCIIINSTSFRSRRVQTWMINNMATNLQGGQFCNSSFLSPGQTCHFALISTLPLSVGELSVQSLWGLFQKINWDHQKGEVSCCWKDLSKLAELNKSKNVPGWDQESSHIPEALPDFSQLEFLSLIHFPLIFHLKFYDIFTIIYILWVSDPPNCEPWSYIFVYPVLCCSPPHIPTRIISTLWQLMVTYQALY